MTGTVKARECFRRENESTEIATGLLFGRRGFQDGVVGATNAVYLDGGA